jgi:CO/xanthine dehydrogenase Mo-binding subunit
VADVRPDRTTVWSGTQFPAGLKADIARWLEVPSDSVRIIYVEGSGCYGRYTVDDAALEAALLSRAVGQPVRVQWSRNDEHGWDHYNPAMVHDLVGSLDQDGNVIGWTYDMWTGRHTGAVLLGNDTGGTWSRPLLGAVGDDTPNFYAFDNQQLTLHAQETAVLRYGNNRSLGAIASSFAAESFMDELAAAAGVDPVEFRLRYVSEPRAMDVLQAAAAMADWDPRPSPQRSAPDQGVVSGRGVALILYGATWVATVAEVEVDVSRGDVRVVRMSVAQDCGLAVNPDGVRNQIEGNVVQSTSRTLKEEVRFDRDGVTTVDWLSYPILTFTEVPEVQVELLNRRGFRPSGAGEAATVPTAAAIGNAIFDATGARMRRVPFTATRVQSALAASVPVNSSG